MDIVDLKEIERRRIAEQIEQLEAKVGRKIDEPVETKQVKVLDITGIDLSVRPPLLTIIDPWLVERKIVYAYAKPKAGKTWWVLFCLLNVAAGRNFYNYVVRKKKVLYIDGEMTLNEMVDRKNKICKANDIDLKEGWFSILSKDEYPEEFIDTLEPVWAKKICMLAEPYDVVAFDNLTCLFGGGKLSENDPRSFQPVYSLFCKLKSKGKTVVFVHHEGKGSNGSRGTSAVDALVDGSIRIEKVLLSENSGLNFKVSFPAMRGTSASSLESIEVNIGKDYPFFSFRRADGGLEEEIKRLYVSKEMSVRSVATVLGLCPQYVWRYLDKEGLTRKRERT